MNKLTSGYCGSTFTYTPNTWSGKLTQFQQGHYQCSNERKHGAKACQAKSLPVYTLRQVCSSLIAPIVGSPEESPFEEAWIEKLVDHIVIFTSALEFHLNTDKVLSAPWKNTARRDSWAHRRKVAQHNSEVIL